MPRRNCLNRPVSRTRATREVLGGEARDRGNVTGSSIRACRRPCTSVALTRPTTSPGKASSIVSRSWPNTWWAYLVANGLPVGSWVTTMPRSNRPEHTRRNAMRSRCDGSMLACTLNTKPENGASSGRGYAVDVGSRAGRGREVDDGVEQLAHAEVGEGRAEEHGRRLAGEEQPSMSSVGPDLRRAARARRPPGSTASPSSVGRARSASTSSSGASVAPRAVAGEAGELAVAAVDHAPEVAGDADRPGDRRGDDADLLLDLVEQLERVAAGPVPLVDEREQRQLALPADLEQLERLRLDALGRVEHHDRGVGGGQHPVGVLGEVAVAGGVEQVDHAVAVGELQHGRGDRDAALLLELHPVRGGRAPPAAGLDRAGLGGERAAVEQELLGERGLAGVGVADDGEGAPARRFLSR